MKNNIIFYKTHARLQDKIPENPLKTQPSKKPVNHDDRHSRRERPIVLVQARSSQKQTVGLQKAHTHTETHTHTHTQSRACTIVIMVTLNSITAKIHCLY